MNQASESGLALMIPPPYAAPPFNVPKAYVPLNPSDTSVPPRSIAAQTPQPEDTRPICIPDSDVGVQDKMPVSRIFRSLAPAIGGTAGGDTEGFAANRRKLRLTLQDRRFSPHQESTRLMVLFGR